MATARSHSAPARTSLRPYLLLLAVFAVIALATVVIAGRSGDADDPVASAEGGPEAGAAPGAAPAEAPGPAAQTCGVDLSYPPIDMARLTAGFPASGPADAPVSVVEVFDPNCPHCKTFYDLLHGDFAAAHPQAKFYYVPFPLWDFSLGQVAALHLASDESPERFFALVDELFKRQGGRGMALDQVVTAGEVAGMNGPMLRQRLTDNLTLDPLIQEIVAHREFVVGAVTHDGQMSVPRLVVNGRFVAPDTQLGYTEECLDRVIAEAAGQAGSAQPSAPSAAE